ncbi:MAG: phosphate ABC transporter permease subunit PstC [Acidimicrobiales bacterium]
MTATSIESQSDLSGKNRVGDRAFRWATYAAGAFVLVVLSAIAVTTTRKAWPAFDEMGFHFFTSRRWVPNEGVFGARALIFGTLYTAVIALVLAVPVSIGIALFTTQVAPARLRRWIVSVVDLLAVIPSVVFGLWGVLFLAPKLPGFFENLHDIFGPVPLLGRLFGTQNGGKSFLTAGVILAIMITPIITSLSREVIDTTPPSDREAAYGLGATRWEMIRGAVLPHSKGGLVGAVMLGLGRAMGETIAVALVVGSGKSIGWNLFGSGDTMPAVIANEWGEAEGTWRAALIALAVTLFVVTIIVNLAATAIVQRSIAKSSGVRR